MPNVLRSTGPAAALLATAATLAACGAETPPPRPTAPPRVAGTERVVRDTVVAATFAASGTAEPLQQATLSTKLMATVTAVLVQEGDVVRAGQPLVRLDARDLAARGAQVAASVAEAEAVRRDAEVQAGRIRALWADSAATRAQLDAVETGLARATAGVRAARAAAGELQATASYAVVRAPFAGVVTQRLVDPGAFAAPGAPLVALQDATRLRIAAHAAPDAVRALRRGDTLAATVEGRAVRAVVEGVVPAAGGNLYTVNALVPNGDRAILPGSAATLALPLGTRRALVVPAAALVREGDLVGVTVRDARGDATRWVRTGAAHGPDDALVEVTAGLRPGDRLVIPARTASAAPVTPEE